MGIQCGCSFLPLTVSLPKKLYTIEPEGDSVKKVFNNIVITALSLLGAFGLSLAFQNFNVEEHITTVFVFAVFFISLFTEGYLYGVLAAFLGTLAVNYAFTFPYFALNFTIPVNLISAGVMIAISIVTSALITKLKQHEATKAESEKERLRANLLRAVSHDIRTPLTTIYGSSTTLLENREEITDEQQAKILMGIKEDADWLIRMVENLLSVTRIDSGQVKINKAPVVLEELIDSVMLKFKKRYSGQKVDIQLPEDVILIPMDAILIEQVIINLLENAVQHAKGMTYLALRVYTQEDTAIFEIADDGCGIPSKRMEKLFAGYSATGDEPADSQKKNAGIGLSVCAAIIKAHGGTIEAENAKTGGAIFRFTLAKEELKNDSE